MKTKVMRLPRSVLVGREAVEQTCEVARGLGLEGPALIVADPTTYEIAGRQVFAVMKGDFQVKTEIVTRASAEEVERIGSILWDEKYLFAVAVGGGRVIDVTKLAAKNQGLDYLSIPTAAAHDGIASARASIVQNGDTVSIEADAPIGIIADTSVIERAPYRLLASGCGDIISKHTSVRDWELARDGNGEEFSEYAAALSLMSAKIVMDSSRTINDGSEESVRKVVKALISCGVAMSIAGSSRPASGSEHKFSHALDKVAPRPALHGEQCGVGTIMMMHLQGGDWQTIKQALSEIGAPTNSRELGIEDRYIVEALIRAREIRPERHTILEEVRLTEADAERIARDTGVIS